MDVIRTCYLIDKPSPRFSNHPEREPKLSLNVMQLFPRARLILASVWHEAKIAIINVQFTELTVISDTFLKKIQCKLALIGKNGWALSVFFSLLKRFISAMLTSHSNAATTNPSTIAPASRGASQKPIFMLPAPFCWTRFWLQFNKIWQKIFTMRGKNEVVEKQFGACFRMFFFVLFSFCFFITIL